MPRAWLRDGTWPENNEKSGKCISKRFNSLENLTFPPSKTRPAFFRIYSDEENYQQQHQMHCCKPSVLHNLKQNANHQLGHNTGVEKRPILQGGSRSDEVWRLLVRKLTRTLISHDRKKHCYAHKSRLTAVKNTPTQNNKHNTNKRFTNTLHHALYRLHFTAVVTSWQYKKSAAQDCNNALVHIVHISNSFQQAQFSDIAI